MNQENIEHQNVNLDEISVVLIIDHNSQRNYGAFIALLDLVSISSDEFCRRVAIEPLK